MALKKNTGVKKQSRSLEPIFQVWAWILLAWSLYRYFFRGMPEWLDELILKPFIFTAPVLYYVSVIEKRTLASIGISSKNFFTSVYIGLGFGLLFALEGIAANALKYGRLDIQPILALQEYGLGALLVFSLATATWEEILSRGFIFHRLFERTNNLPYAAILSSFMFVLLHVPILVTALKFQGLTLVVYFLTNFILGIANSLLFYNTRTVVAPILVHLFWNMTVALYL